MKLTARLQAVADCIPHGTVFADIGTDHAYIPVYMCSEGYAPQVIAADIGAGPLLAAQSHVAGAGLAQCIDCRLGDGLSCIAPGEAAGAVICGMGGMLIVRILTQSPSVWENMEFLVLQPQSDSAAVRRFLYGRGWHLDRETLVMDDGRLYEIMRAVPGGAERLPDWQYEIGPLNWSHQEPLLAEKINAIIHKKERIIQGLRKSRKDKEQEMLRLETEIQEWRDRLCRLQQVK